MNFETAAFLFPGQGSQSVGMGQALAASSETAANLFAEADDILGFALSELCWNGPADELNDTINTQPALYVTSMAALAVLKEVVPNVQPAFIAGHSLGQVTAAAAAGALSFADGLRLVRERGRLMKLAGERSPGGMAAVIRLDADKLTAVCEQASAETGKPVQLANDNCPGQVVISGDNAALDLAETLAKEAGARMVKRLPVSIAAHSQLMESVSAEYGAAVDAATLSLPAMPLIANSTAVPVADLDSLRAEFKSQLTSPVRWTESVQYMIKNGVTSFIEIGSGNVLTGLLKRIDRSVSGYNVNSTDSISELLK